jgi:hypothetical protein
MDRFVVEKSVEPKRLGKSKFALAGARR